MAKLNSVSPVKNRMSSGSLQERFPQVTQFGNLQKTGIMNSIQVLQIK